MKKPIVLYHANCHDGFTAAWVFWTCFGDEFDYVPCAYGDDFNLDAIDDREAVLMVDFCLPIPVIQDLLKRDAKIYLIDHHKSALAATGDLVDAGDIIAYTDIDRSGAGLAWDYFRNDYTIDGRSGARWSAVVGERPLLVDFVEDYDLWRFDMDHTRKVLAVVHATGYDFDKWDEMADRLDTDDGYKRIVYDGTAILQYIKKTVREICDTSVHEIDFGSTRVPALNVPYVFANEACELMLDRFDPTPMVASYFYTGGKWRFSLRSRWVDVSGVAKKYGGGGHKNAAGFEVDDLTPFLC
jgi:oligoribonuclease NrnB/cAMP/cGMP phosphodiesterase (DHH superfamily)